jgi:hypothetical protein
MVVRPRRAVIDLLQQDNVRLAVRDRLDDPFRPVSAVDPADALVNVVGE